MSPIEGGHRVDVESFGKGHHGGIDSPQRKVVIARDELGNPDPIAGVNGFHEEIARREISEKPDLCPPSQPSLEEVDDLGDDELWHQQRTRMRLEEREAGLVGAVVLVDVGVQGSGINDQCDRESPVG